MCQGVGSIYRSPQTHYGYVEHGVPSPRVSNTICVWIILKNSFMSFNSTEKVGFGVTVWPTCSRPKCICLKVSSKVSVPGHMSLWLGEGKQNRTLRERHFALNKD